MKRNEFLQIMPTAVHPAPRMSMRRFLTTVFLLAAASVANAQFGFGAATKVALKLDAQTVRPGDKFTAALQMSMPEGYHTYWVNPGTGLPTEIKWTLPEGVAAGEIQWPVPEKYEDKVSGGYVYHGDVYLLIPMEIGAGVPNGEIELKGEVSWLECKTSCIPGSGDVSARLTIGPDRVASAEASSFDEWRKRLPEKKTGLPVRAVWDSGAEGEERAFVIEWKAGEPLPAPDFYPFASENLEVQPKTETATADGTTILRKTIKKYEGEWPTELRGVLIANAAKPEESAAYETTIAIGDPTGEPATGEPGSDAAGPAPSPGLSLPKVLFFAFLGGLILNVMPCVLPVIALKILGFVNQSKEEPGRVKTLGFIYTLGVLASFLAMALLIIGVQQAGRVASWGMQFSNIYFLVGLTVLVTLVALNLFGVFEVTLGGGAMSAAGGLASKEGNAGAFFNGVLATTLATPCTAPFLAPALGFAFTQPPAIIVVVFLTVGAGLASPYLLLSWKPEWLRHLPKPGAWMERFKVAMGFPMLGTAVVLLWLTLGHFGEIGALWFGLFLVSVALCSWIYGEFVQRGRKHRQAAVILMALILFGSYGFTMERQLNWRALRAQPVSIEATGQATDPDKIAWQSWSREAVAAARKEGRPVFVDFTANWCATCKFNKASFIETSEVRAKLREVNAVALVGDNTLSPPEIAEELRRYGRAGVPLNLVFPVDESAEPIVLPTLLSKSIILNALDKAAAGRE